MVSAPNGSSLPLTARVAVAVLLAPLRVAVPSETLPRLKATVPVGAPPPELVTVAVRLTVPVERILAALRESDKFAFRSAVRHAHDAK